MLQKEPSFVAGKDVKLEIRVEINKYALWGYVSWKGCRTK
jgi:hypothetical protein